MSIHHIIKRIKAIETDVILIMHTSDSTHRQGRQLMNKEDYSQKKEKKII